MTVLSALSMQSKGMLLRGSERGSRWRCSLSTLRICSHCHRTLTQKGDTGLAATTHTHTHTQKKIQYLIQYLAPNCGETFINTSNMFIVQLLPVNYYFSTKFWIGGIRNCTGSNLNDVRWDDQNPIMSDLELDMAMPLNEQIANLPPTTFKKYWHYVESINCCQTN